MGRRKREADELTEQEERFVAEYLSGEAHGNATEAARRAGYSESTAKGKAPLWVNRVSAYRVGKGRVFEAINKARLERYARVKVDGDYLILNAAECLERCMQRTPVVNAFGAQVKDENGNNLWRFDSIGANKSIDTLAKLLGSYKENNLAEGKHVGNIIVTDEKSEIYQIVLDTVRETAKNVRLGNAPLNNEDSTPEDGETENKEE